MITIYKNCKLPESNDILDSRVAMFLSKDDILFLILVNRILV